MMMAGPMMTRLRNSSWVPDLTKPAAKADPSGHNHGACDKHAEVWLKRIWFTIRHAFANALSLI
jgi:hypothetical protein